MQPRTKPISREYRIYLALWRKALSIGVDGPPVTFHASTYAMALSIRSGMYKAIKPYRYDEVYDPDLKSASELFVVTTGKDPGPDGTYPVSLTPRKTLSELEAELVALGITEDDLRQPEETTAEADLSGLIERIQTEPAPRSNPFYTRED